VPAGIGSARNPVDAQRDIRCDVVVEGFRMTGRDHGQGCRCDVGGSKAVM
jgi:hypothetical protein